MRQVTIRTKDYFYIISFPRSGNTWIVNSLREYLGAQRAEIAPSVYGGEELTINRALRVKVAGEYTSAHPIGVKTHMSRSEFDRKRLPWNRILYLVRDVRDVMTSYYFYIHGFLNKDTETIQNFSPAHFQEHLERRLPEYKNHVEGWLKHDGYDVLVVRYEELKTDYIETLKRIRSFLQLANLATETEVKCKYVDNFRQQDKFTSVLRGDNMDFYRKGVVGDWKNYFTEEHIKTVKRVVGPLLLKLRYETDQNW
jgi:hypothetical protein